MTALLTLSEITNDSVGSPHAKEQRLSVVYNVVVGQALVNLRLIFSLNKTVLDQFRDDSRP